MNIYLFLAGMLCLLLGIAHSIIGERNIFSSKRTKGNIVPTQAGTYITEKHLQIIWVVWHFVSVFIFFIGGIVLNISLNKNKYYQDSNEFIIQAILLTLTATSILILLGTKGKHPVWIAFLIIISLLLIGM
ncbi:hypothetical protein [Aquimarina algicola]|uniref:Uncharacterized protein n=1 Tax=Aquimarina algicola TaxID=2589995 RepID=A0A504JGH0_9FLAO|nr:hypothetical protein [Aquimarina algicola]TPN86753.1 hypothetical protein FHK87_03900 [Aquimarina algicola]